MAEPFSYDVVEYPSAPLPQVHPGHLFAVARLYGLDPAPPARCRFLEVGCGDGAHLIACAADLPDATFVGIDLSAVAIERGNRMIAEFGLPNVTLYAADLTRWEPPGRFDYAVSHGCYSWVPAPVRDGLLALIARSLTPHGVGYVSYNAYPGCFVRRMVWEMMKRHTTGITDPGEKSGQALEFVKFLRAAQPEKPGPELATYAKELDDILAEKHPGLLYHDDLSDTNEPVFFQQFAAHAAEHRLRFVAEAEPNVMATRALPKAVANVLDGMAAEDVLDKEQYLDFIRLRRFRQTLLAADGRPPQAEPDAARVPELAVSGKAKPDPDPCDLAAGAAVSFANKNGAMARTDLPIAKAALTVLAPLWPGRVWFADLVKLAAAALGRAPTPADADDLAGFLVRVWETGLVELHGHVPRYAAEVSARPVASPIARLMLRTGSIAATVFLTPMLFDDAPSRRMVQLLDGTRTLDDVARELATAFPPEGRPDPAALRAGVEQRLARMAHGGLLVG